MGTIAEQGVRNVLQSCEFCSSVQAWYCYTGSSIIACVYLAHPVQLPRILPFVYAYVSLMASFRVCPSPVITFPLSTFPASARKCLPFHGSISFSLLKIIGNCSVESTLPVMMLVLNLVVIPVVFAAMDPSPPFVLVISIENTRSAYVRLEASKAATTMPGYTHFGGGSYPLLESSGLGC